MNEDMLKLLLDGWCIVERITTTSTKGIVGMSVWLSKERATLRVGSRSIKVERMVTIHELYTAKTDVFKVLRDACYTDIVRLVKEKQNAEKV